MGTILSASKTLDSTPDVVTVSEIKDYLKISGSDEDSLIQAMIDGAVLTYEGETGELLRPHTVTLEVLGPWKQHFPYKPITGTVSVTQDGTSITLSITVRGDYITLYDGQYTVEAPCGYASGEVPADIVSIIKQMVVYEYANRGTLHDGDMDKRLPMSIQRLIDRRSINRGI